MYVTVNKLLVPRNLYTKTLFAILCFVSLEISVLRLKITFQQNVFFLCLIEYAGLLKQYSYYSDMFFSYF